MSCFKGQMDEYTNIAIDRFDGKNLQCSAFFLSHCHKDHMQGLNSPTFHDHLISRQNVYLYCTEISRMLLLAEEGYSPLEKNIRTLEVGITHLICVPRRFKDDLMVRVTLVSAGHCPGSVMFLFEGEEGTVLYTGDFRWEANQAAKIAAFRDGSHIKPIKSLYIDTTFCIPEAYHIPSRRECLDATLDLVSDWLSRDSHLHIVSMSCPAKYGHEHLLAQLSRRLNTKIHVPDWKINIYNQIPELRGIFAQDPNECKIHACTWKCNTSKASKLPCGHAASNGERFRILTIRPSTMWFTSNKTRASVKDLVVAPASHRGLHRVCYSMHSSYSEISDVVSFLQPDKVLPNVLPAPDDNFEAVQKRLDTFRMLPHKSRLSNLDGVGNSFKPLGVLKTKTTPPSRKMLSSGCSSSEELVFSSQEQSPKKPKGLAGKNSACQHSDIEEIQEELTPSKSVSASSSFESLHGKDEELNLFSDDSNDKTDEDEKVKEKVKGEDKEESLRLYISGESEAEGDDSDRSSDENGTFDSVRKKEKNDSALFVKHASIENSQNGNFPGEIQQHDYSSYDRLVTDRYDNNDDDDDADHSSDSEIIPNSQENIQENVPFSAYTSSQSKLKGIGISSKIIDCVTVCRSKKNSLISADEYNVESSVGNLPRSTCMVSYSSHENESTETGSTSSRKGEASMGNHSHVKNTEPMRSTVPLSSPDDKDVQKQCFHIEGNIKDVDERTYTQIELPEENNVDEEDCFIIGNDSANASSISSLNGGGKYEELGEDITITSVSSTNASFRSEILSSQFSQSSYFPQTKKRKKDIDGEKESVEFLYDEPSTSIPLRMPEDHGWLSRATPRLAKDKRKSRKIIMRDGQNDTIAPESLQSQTIDLTLNDSL